MQRHAGEDGNDKKESGKAKAFDFINVVAEKNKKTGACANGKSRNSGTEAENSLRIKFRNDDGRSAVGNKSDHARNQRLEETFAHHKARKSIFADGVDADFENEHNNKDESESGSGVEQGALEEPVMAFGAAMGIGVTFSVLFILVFQGGLTLLAGVVGPALSAAVVTEMSAVGGTILVGMAINMLGLAPSRIKVANMLQAIFLPVL